MSPSKFSTSCVVCLIYITLFLGCTKVEEPVVKGTQRKSQQATMQMILDIVRDRSQSMNPFFESASIGELEMQRQSIDETQSPRQAFMANFNLCLAQRRVGEDEAATESISRAEQIAEKYQLITDDLGRSQFFFEAGLTWLRLAESTNCVHCRTGESCILPIQGTGVHRQRIGSEKACEYFLKSLSHKSDNLDCIWLLNIAKMTLGEYPDGVPEMYRIAPEKFSSPIEFPRFLDVAQPLGLKTTSNGGAAVTDDFDNDGLIDVFASSWAPDDVSRIHMNKGDGKFVDFTSESGIGTLAGGINAVQGDYDNDGLVDIYLVRGAWGGSIGRVPNSLYHNLGGGKFEDVTFDVGLGESHHPTPTACWGDFDNDGDLDLFVGNEQEPCQLFRNDGQKGFVDVATQAGVTNGYYTKAAVWGDFNQDRLPDLYVTNLDAANRLYRNKGDGSFEDVAMELGVANPISSFSGWFWDVNNDGWLDIYTASYLKRVDIVAADYLDIDLESEQDCLYLSDGKGGFADVAHEFGLTEATEPMGCNFGDLDNDGYLDFYLGTGFPDYQGLMPNLMYRNRGGKGFDNVTFAGGFGHLQKGHGTSFVDLNNDGSQDIFIQMGGAYKGDAFGDVLFANPGFGNHFLNVKLIGTKSNKSAIGARIKATFRDGGETRSVYMWVNSGGNFGARPLAQFLGLGSATVVDKLEIYWPTTDTTQNFKDVVVDQFLEVTEGSDKYQVRRVPSFKYPQPDLTATVVP